MTKKLLFLLTLLPSILLSQNSIKGTFTPADEYKWIILYKVTPTTSIYVDNAEIAQDGSFEILLDSSATKGVYRIVYAVPQKQFNFDIIYNKKEDVELTFSQDNGVDFVKSNENKLLSSYTRSIMMVNEAINKFYSTNSKNEKSFTGIFNTLKEAQKSFEDASKGTIASYFIKANSPYIPESYEDVRTYSKNLRNNFLKHVDFNEPVLQNSEFLIERMLAYVFGMTSNPDDIDVFKNNVDDIVNAIKSTNLDYQKTLLEILWNQFADIENETMANYVATNYLIPISEDLKDDELINKLIVFKNTSISEVAPDFSVTFTKNDHEVTKKLSELHIANRYVIVFWSSSCSHCLKELPELKKYLQTTGDDTKVIAIGLEDEPYNWNNETSYCPEFIHVYGEGKWDNPIGDNYGVTATPTYYLLNKDKQIIAKPYDFEALKKYLEENPVRADDSKKESEKED